MEGKKKTKYVVDYRGFIPIISAIFTLLVDIYVPNHKEAKYGDLTDFRNVLYVVVAVLIILFIITIFHKKFRERYSYQGWFLGGAFLFLNGLNLVTVKLLWLPQMYFPSLNRIINVFVTDHHFLLECMLSSFTLLIEGVIAGSIIGVITGILVGWSKKWSYWIYPIIRMLGPIPSSTWIPLALIAFPSARGASVFLIAFGVWFQITILTSSGIQSVKKSYFEVSSTLGATNLQNLFRVAIPDALPSMFLGFFNATCSSFVALMAAEMLGCKSGIGWYINWQKEMLSYPNVYAGLIIIATFCYLFLTIQFKVRDRLLGWQKGVIKW